MDSENTNAHQYDFDKKTACIIASVAKALADDSTKPNLYFREVPFNCTQEQLVALGSKLVIKFPKVAFLLVGCGRRFQFTIAISKKHPTMGEFHTRIFDHIYDLVSASAIIKGHAATTYTVGAQTSTGYMYFGRELCERDYTGKLTDAVIATMFGYFKLNGYLPEDYRDNTRDDTFDGNNTHINNTPSSQSIVF